jgi:predicted nucleic acid-binding Zn ribbon protein
MEFRCYCDNQECHQEMNPVVDKDTLVAYCTVCNKPINNVSVFMKRQLVYNGQVVKQEVKKSAWALKCPKCTQTGTPIEQDGKLCCAFCKEPIPNVNPVSEKLIRQYLKSRKSEL